MKELTTKFCRQAYQQHYRLLVLFTLTIVCFFSLFVHRFQLDTSADALVLDSDPSLHILREIQDQFGIQEYVVITYTPFGELFSEKNIELIESLKSKLAGIENVESITSLTDAPLLKNSDADLSQLTENIKTLTSADVDLEAAREEILNSPLYRGQLVSKDGGTTALLVVFTEDRRYKSLLQQRDELRKKQKQGNLNSVESSALEEITEEFQLYKSEFAKQRHQDINLIRRILKSYENDGDLFLGGVPMVADDMMTYVRNDILIFGGGVFAFIFLLLFIIFRDWRWIALPLLCCIFTSLIMVGFLGFIDWRVTVVSSNFISLMIIFTLSIVVHLVVKYRELRSKFPQRENQDIVFDTVKSMIAPCFYTSITTVVAFASLVISDIIPVIHFGWMMAIGMLVALFITFIFLPSAIIWLGKAKPSHNNKQFDRITEQLAKLTLKYKRGLPVTALLALTISIYGISKLEVENSFINYFGKDTEIYAGMKLIDDKLGGTVPLEIVVDLTRFSPPEEETLDEDFAFDDELEFSYDEEASLEEDTNRYWFTSEKMALIKNIHQYLESIEAIGTVTSLHTFIQIAQDFTDKPLTTFELALLYSKIPEQFHTALFTPYLSFDSNQVRFSARILDSTPDLRRNDLIEQIRQDLSEQFELEENEVILSGLLVMYNNMLQSLFSSQILTIWAVLGAIYLMLLSLYRSFIVALIGIIPNCLSASIVLGLIGLLNIPLDMMTITIAAICIGIGVDGTIHYLHRFRHELGENKDYQTALVNSHGSIGNAIFYTSLIVVFGFSILCLSNFIPTIYFGLLTGIAMAIALLNNLTLLPRLIVLSKPFGR